MEPLGQNQPAAASPSPSPPNTGAPPPGRHKLFLPKQIILALVVAALVAAAGFAGYNQGYSRGQSSPKTAASQTATTAPSLTVPTDATIISQCAKGRGTQYVLPKDIPNGPVYNVFQGKVIGLEYMIGKDDLANSKNFLALPMFGQKYDHMDVGLLSQGHAGFPEPHYHIDLYNITPSASAAITCSS